MSFSNRFYLPHGRGVLEGLGLHDTLHVGGPAVLGGDDAAWGGDHTVGDDNLLDLLVEDVLKMVLENCKVGF